MTDPHQQIKHAVTLHRLHKCRHKRYRESPLCQAMEDLARIEPPPVSVGQRDACLLYAGLAGACMVTLLWVAVEVMR